MSELKLTKPSVAKQIYKILYDTVTILDNNGILYFADGGTFLGAIRHSGLIPWDDDADLVIFEKDLERFLKLKSQFRKCGYGVVKVYDSFGATFGYKIFYKSHKNIEGYNWSFPFIDIFLYKKIGNKWKPILKEVRDTWPNEWFAEDELFPIKNYKFGNFTIKGPNKYKNYFDRLYGKDWNTIAYRQYDHAKEEEVVQVKVRLTSRDRSPAPYPKLVKRKCIEKSCPKGQEKNPNTGRCNKIGGVAWKKWNTKKSPKRSSGKPCPRGQERNPNTGRCNKIGGVAWKKWY